MANKYLPDLQRYFPPVKAEGFSLPRSADNYTITVVQTSSMSAGANTVTFASLGMRDMASATSYHVSVEGPAGDEFWDVNAGSTASQFVLNGGAAGGVCSLLIVGVPADAE